MASSTRPAYLLACFTLLAILLVTLFHYTQTPAVEYQRALLNSIFKVHNNAEHRTHDEVFSLSTTDQKYFLVDFGDQEALNPNIIPHPTLDETWIVVAQLRQESQASFLEIACNAVFLNNTLKCVDHASALPIAPTYGDKCTGDLQYINLNVGPHDARVFYGPRAPFAIFGSNSQFTCFGQWIQDLRTLVDWDNEQYDKDEFVEATELQRPPPWGVMEKNWFLFFDQDDQAYLHYDVSPQRVFAKVSTTGEVGPDLGYLTAAHDEVCMDKYMPKIGPELESIHQATNSLLVTMCNKKDSTCFPDHTNTFIFTIFQHKTYFSYHALYEPYVMLFERTAPFKLHAISKRPFWIHGRKGSSQPGAGDDSQVELLGELGEDQEEMFYVTSISWKSREQKYHGYLDDVLLVSFGIEDKQTAAIDISVGDLLQDLGTC